MKSYTTYPIREKIQMEIGDNTRKINKKYLLSYTIVFAILTTGVFWRFLIENKSFVWTVDGWTQHYKALNYYSDWLQGIVWNLIKNHKFVIPQWSGSIGYGSDIITTLNYYVIGDPLNLLSVFVPNQYMVYFYDALIVVRIYLAGLSFSYYCFSMKKSNPIAVLAGSFIYCYCGFVLYAAVHHPYFTNPLIYFPLLLLGTEKILQRQKPWLFIGMVFLAAVSNFYFFYMLVIFTALYVVFRLFMLYDKTQIKNAVFSIFRLFGYAFIGLFLSAFIFLPVVLLFLGDSRSDSHYVFDGLYSAKYYKNFLSMFFTYTSENWTFLHYSSITFLSIFLMFLQKRKHIALKVALVLMTVFLLFPVFGYLFNGFSYVANRWTWSYSMLIAYIVVEMWDELFQISKRKTQIIGLLMLGCAGMIICISENYTFFVLVIYITVITIIALLALGIMRFSQLERFRKYRNWSQVFVLGLICVTIGGNAVFYFRPSALKEYKNKNVINRDLMATQDAAVKEASKKDISAFHRYSGTFQVLARNSTLNSGLFSTHYFWSLDNGVIKQFMTDMGMLCNVAYNYRELDNRTILNTLANVKYYVIEGDGSEEQYIPYAYTKKGTYYVEGSDKADRLSHKTNDYAVYQNRNFLPLGYTYNNYVSQEMYDRLSAAEKQEAMLQGIYLKEDLADYDKTELDLKSRELDYTISCKKNVKKKGNSFVVKKKNAKVKLNFEGMSDSETYLDIQNLNFENAKKVKADIHIKASGSDVIESKKTLTFYTNKEHYYNNRHNFLINLNYNKKPRTSITITFSEEGTYTFDKLAVVCQPMDNYESQVDALKQDILEAVNMGTNEITGEISLDRNKILCLSIPYSTGWTAYVDGQRAELLQANTMYMALPLRNGKHTVCLVYETPGLRMGIYISIFGLVLLIGIWYHSRLARASLE